MDESGDLATDESLVRGESLGMKRTAARVLATNLQWRTRDEAVKRLEELDQRQALTAEDRYLLAQLYEARGEWPSAQKQYDKLSQAPDRRPQHLIAYAQGLLAQKQVTAAERVIERLENMDGMKTLPGAELALLELRVRRHEAKREGDKALRLLRDRLDKQGDQGAQEVLLLIASYGRQQRFTEALGVLDRLWKLAPPEMAGGTSVALLRAGKPTKEQREQVAAHLEAAHKKDPKNVTLLVQLGDVRDMLGELTQAETVYRDALKLAPTNVMTLNNLAWLLALRAEKPDEALKLINTAIETAGPRGELLDTRAVVYLMLGRPKQALTDLERSLKEAPTPTRLFHLAQAHHQANNRQGARQAFLEAKKLGLEASQLHPVEQVAHRKLEEELSR
jgi:tetratricopeptide (TPR) repeat protein